MDEKNWFLYITDHHEGPFSEAEVQAKVKSGQADMHCYVWKDGMADWVMMSEASEFKSDSAAGKPSFAVQKQAVRSSSSKALGFSGKPSTVRYRWYKSTKFFALMVFVALGCGYWFYGKKSLDPYLSQLPIPAIPSIPGISTLNLSKVSIPGLEALNVESAERKIMQNWGVIDPYYQKVEPFLPGQVKAFLARFQFQIPQEVKAKLSASQIETLKDAVLANPKKEARVVSFLEKDEEATPKFILASNFPDQTKFKVWLKSKPDFVLHFEDVFAEGLVEIKNHLGSTPVFSVDGNAIPMGEYYLVIFEDETQEPQISKMLSDLPRKSTPSFVPAGKIAFVVDNYFLGGKRDQNFTESLKKFNEEKIHLKQQAFSELGQAALTIESIANESATRFFELKKSIKMKSSKLKWAAYHKQYLKMSDQIKLIVVNESYKKVEPLLTQKLSETLQSSDGLHELENQFMSGKGDLTEIQKAAGVISEQIVKVKQMLEKK